MQPQRENAKISLPQSEQQRENLLNQINELIEQLCLQNQQNAEDKKLVEQNNEKIATLQLRLKLIAQCGEFSMLRLNHLQQIFKHYCTHVFRTGKHMTFDRLEYDQVHMTIERFFLFLKDFELTTMEINGKTVDAIEKPTIITLFKKVSSTCRELSFEQFIQCLEKLGILYFDEKANYFKKIEEEKKEKVRRKKEMEKRKIQRMKLNGIQVPKEESKQQGNENEQENDGKGSDVPVSHEQIQANNENDDLVKEMMEDKDLEDPNAEVNQIARRANKENEAALKKREEEMMNQERLIMLSNEEKIEYYYKIINVDSLADFKKRLTELNLPIFQKQKDKIVKPEKQSSKALSESKLEALSLQEEERLRKIKEKMNEKKEKFKDRAIPKPSNEQALKESQNSKRRKQLKKQREQSIKKVKEEIDTAVLAKKLQVLKPKNPAIKQVEYKDSEVSWDVLQKISLQQMKMKQFNPTKLYSAEDEDNIFMQEYGGGGRTKVTSGLEVRERQSLSIVENVKKRADEVEKTEKKNQKKFDKISKNMGGSVASKNKF